MSGWTGSPIGARKFPRASTRTTRGWLAELDTKHFGTWASTSARFFFRSASSGALRGQLGSDALVMLGQFGFLRRIALVRLDFQDANDFGGRKLLRSSDLGIKHAPKLRLGLDRGLYGLLPGGFLRRQAGHGVVKLLLSRGLLGVETGRFGGLLRVGNRHSLLAAADDRLLDIGEESPQREEIVLRHGIELVIVALQQPSVWPSQTVPIARTRSVSMRAS